MKLSELLQRELKTEVHDDFEAYNYSKLRIIADSIGVGVYALEAFINTDLQDSNGIVELRFIDRLFERYRNRLINPIKSGKFNKLNSANNC